MIRICQDTGRSIFIGKDGNVVRSEKLTAIAVIVASGNEDAIVRALQNTRLTRGEMLQCYEDTHALNLKMFKKSKKRSNGL